VRALCYSGVCREGPRFPDEAPLACAVVCSADGTACADGFVHFVNEFGETILSQQVRACARARGRHPRASTGVMSYVVRQVPFLCCMLWVVRAMRLVAATWWGSVYCSGACGPRFAFPSSRLACLSWATAAERRSVPFPSAVALAVLCKRRCRHAPADAPAYFEASPPQPSRPPAPTASSTRSTPEYAERQ
jgi:hypothetical protein